MAAKKKGRDWFESLDRELEKRTEQILQDEGEEATVRGELNRQLIEDFWRIWKRFSRINVHFTLEPTYNAWATFEDTFPDGPWHWRPGFNPATVATIRLVDRTQEQGRVGDALKVSHYMDGDTPRVKVTFEYCEGEHYYKYSGWKRIWSLHTLYDEALDKVELKDLHAIFTDVIKAWYESHLRRDRDLLIKHVKRKYERVETFKQ
jgi:hypothetical protein